MLKVSDLASGLIVAGIGVVIMVQSTKFPTAAGIPIGPSVYPGVIGAVLALLGTALAIRSLMQRQALPLAELPPWLRPGRPLVAVMAIPVAITAYALLAPQAGFLATSLGVLFGLLLAFGVRLTVSATVAVLVSAFLYVMFRILMRVPLPAGILERLLQ